MSDPIQAAIDAEREKALRALRAESKLRPPSAAARYAAFERLRDEMGEALAYRLGGPEPEHDAAIRHVGSSFGEMVSTLLSLRGERLERHHDPLHRGIVSGDVPALLEGAGNRMLRKAYQSFEGGLLGLCERVRTRDLRDVKAIQVDGDVGLVEVKEAGEFTMGSVKASAESYAINGFGRIFGISRNLFESDDLDAFGDMAARLGTMAAEFAAAKVAALLESNPTLSDGVAAFHAGHGNLGTTGALSETTVAELVKLVRSQKGLGGQSIAVRPAALVVPTALEFTARKIVSAITPGNSAPPFEVVVEPRLASATGFYLIADPATVAAIAFTYGGGEGPTIAVGQRPGFTGLQAKVAMDFGCGFSDHRGAAKNVGG
jgi:hypothetical protein